MLNKKTLLVMQDIEEGGVQKVFITLANELSRNGCDVTLLVLKKSEAFAQLLDKDVKYINLNSSKVIFSLIPLIQYFKKNKPEICMSAIAHVNVFIAIVKLLFKFNFKHIISEHTNCSKAEKNARRWNLRIAYGLQRYVYPFADSYICVSQGVADDLVERINTHSSKVKVIPNPVITREMRTLLNEKNKFGRVGKRILAVGRLVPEKNHEFLIRSFSLLVNNMGANTYKLDIVGDGPEFNRLNELVKELHLEHCVCFHGFTPKPYEYFMNADLFALTSKHEGFGLVLVEALFFCGNVISIDCPSGPSEVLNKGEFGILAPYNTSESQFASMMNEALLEPLSESELMASRERAEVYSAESITERYCDVFTELYS